MYRVIPGPYSAFFEVRRCDSNRLVGRYCSHGEAWLQARLLNSGNAWPAAQPPQSPNA